MKILISNDDGVSAEGIKALAREFSDHSVVVVAPERERSTTGHSLTLHKPLRMHRLEKNVYSVSGGPADCVLVALNEIYKGKKPDLVLSGINRGANLGQDVFYSGTASAAREAANHGIPAVAVSLSLDFQKKGVKENYGTAARGLRQVLNQALAHFAGKKGASWAAGLRSWHPGMMLNVNVPNLPYGKVKGIGIATQGYRIYSTKLLKRVDFRGRNYFWIGGEYQGFRNLKDSDCWYVDRGYIAVTPLELDTTMKDVYLELKGKWRG
ncbi:MAG TPA: 5'/3'-nucleotidase SurE [Bdellovibrionota bacterium]|jgi:5'-nucleotidase